MRRWKLTIVLVVIYVLFCVLYTQIERSKERSQLEKFANFFVFQLWQLDEETIEMMSKVMMENSNIRGITVYGENGEVFSSVERDLNALERVFLNLHLFWERNYSFELEYNSHRIGTVEFQVIVKDVLVYLYALLVVGLLYHLIKHYLRLKYTLRELDSVNKELKSTVEELEYTIEELERTQEYLISTEKMASIGRLVAGIAHDLNTPIGIIHTSSTELLNNIDRLKRSYENGRISKGEFEDFLKASEEIVSLIQKNSKKVIDLVRGLKSLSAHEDYNVPVKFNLKKHLEDILETLKPKIRKTKVKIHLECPDITIRSFPGALSQIISNLVENSIIHGFENGQMEGNIKIKVKDMGNYIEILYEDDGKGMSDEVKRRVFEPFFTTKRESGGSGLGMAIIYTLVKEKLKGEIFLESQPGKGVRIKIDLPKNAERREEI